jgi:hypothetical protein
MPLYSDVYVDSSLPPMLVLFPTLPCSPICVFYPYKPYGMFDRLDKPNANDINAKMAAVLYI